MRVLLVAATLLLTLTVPAASAGDEVGVRPCDGGIQVVTPDTTTKCIRTEAVVETGNCAGPQSFGVWLNGIPLVCLEWL